MQIPPCNFQTKTIWELLANKDWTSDSIQFYMSHQIYTTFRRKSYVNETNVSYSMPSFIQWGLHDKFDKIKFLASYINIDKHIAKLKEKLQKMVQIWMINNFPSQNIILTMEWWVRLVYLTMSIEFQSMIPSSITSVIPCFYSQCLRWGGMASCFFSKSPETIPLPFNSSKIILPPF
jgi:hypothetical protein